MEHVELVKHREHDARIFKAPVSGEDRKSLQYNAQDYIYSVLISDNRNGFKMMGTPRGLEVQGVDIIGTVPQHCGATIWTF